MTASLDSSWPADSLHKIKSSADKLLTAGFNGLCNYIYTENKHLGYYTKLMQTIMGSYYKAIYLHQELQNCVCKLVAMPQKTLPVTHKR